MQVMSETVSPHVLNHRVKREVSEENMDIEGSDMTMKTSVSDLEK